MASQKSLSSIPLLLAGGLFIWFGLTVRQDVPYDQRAWTFIPIVAGALFFFCGGWIIQRGMPAALERFLERVSGRLQVKEWQVICLFLCLPTAALVPAVAGQFPEMVSPLEAVTFWIAAIGLAVAGGWAQSSPLRWPSRNLVFLAIGLTFVAFLVRGLLTDHIPVILTGDEGSAGLEAVYYARGEKDNIFITDWYGFPSLYFVIQAAFVQLLGRTTEALRIPSAIAGALTVTATFFTARAMFGNRTAWFAAVSLTALHFHIHFSRIGLNNIWDGLWYIVAIGAFWYGWEKDRRNAYLLAGLSLGISQYFYPSGRTILALILGWVLLAALFDRPRLKQAWVNLLLMFAVTVTVLLPLAWHYIQYPLNYLAPLARVYLSREWLDFQIQVTGMPAWKIIVRQIALGFGGFTFEPLNAWYTPGTPILRPFSAALFLTGIILLLLKGRKWQIFPLLLWLAAFGAIGALSESTPAAQRYVAAAPVCALLVGYGLSEGAGLFEKLWPGAARWIATAAILTAAALALGDLRFYFGEFTPNEVGALAHSNGMIAQRLADYLKTQPSDTQVVFFGAPYMGYYSIPSIQYLAPDIRGLEMVESWGSPANPQPDSERLIFVFLPFLEDQIALVRADYPGGVLTRRIASDGQILFWMYQVPPPENPD